MHTNIHTNIHTYHALTSCAFIHTYIHILTYIHTYVYTCTCIYTHLVTPQGQHQVRIVPYSEHSNYPELIEFIRFLKPRQVCMLFNYLCMCVPVSRCVCVRMDMYVCMYVCML